VVGVILDAKSGISHWAENTGAFDVARLRSQFKCRERQRYAAIVTLLFSIYTCCSIAKSLITTLLLLAHKVQAEGKGARYYRQNELDDFL
jgi:hypothetical protein